MIRRNLAFPSVFGSLLDNVDLPSTLTRRMQTSVKEFADHMEFSIELPGYKRENISISLEENVLTITAKASAEKENHDNAGKVIYCERSYSDMSRQFAVPEGTTHEDIAAKLADGVLVVHVDFREPEEKVVKTSIEIQ